MSSPNFSTKTYSIAANSVTPLAGQGSMVKNINTAAAAGAIELIVSEGRQIRFDQGDKYTMPAGENFMNLTLVNTTASAVTVVVGIASGDIDNASDVNIANIVDTVERGGNTRSNAAVSVDDTADGTLILASDTDSTGIAIFNNSTTDTLYIGVSGVTTTTGFPVLPQTAYGDDIRDDLYGIAASGKTIDVRYMKGKTA